MEPQISFSGHIGKGSRQQCENRLWQTLAGVPMVSKILCHVSDRQVEYSGTIFVQLVGGAQLAAHSIADDPVDVIDDLILSIEDQMKYFVQTMKLTAADRSKVIIVDDDPESVARVQRVLTNLNQPSVYVQNPYEAIEMMVHDQYKLVIMDLSMPELSGQEVVAQADARLHLGTESSKRKKRNFVTFSGDTVSNVSPSNLTQFNYMGHWAKQQGYRQLLNVASRTLSTLNLSH